MKISDYDTTLAWEYENGFHLTTDPSRIGKIIAHYELYKQIVDLPGHVIELGVFKGASLIRFLTFKTLLEAPFSRKIIGFDAFGHFPEGTNPQDRDFIAAWEKCAGQGLSVAALDEILQFKKLVNYELIPGDITQTVPHYVQQHPALKVALLHIDTDIYEPAVAGLDYFWPKMVPGGLVVLDDYGTEYGGTKAVDEFLAANNIPIRKLRLSHASPAFLVKP